MKIFKIHINPLSDFGFKRIFGTSGHEDILIHFLNITISRFVGVISDIHYLQTEHLGNSPSTKKVVFDIYCATQDDENFIIEMQKGNQPYFSERIITYISRIVSEEAESGTRKYNIPNTYSLSLLNFNAPEFSGRDRYFWKVQLKDDDNAIFTDKIMLFFVELCKFAAQTKPENFNSEMDRWLYLLTHIEDMSAEEADAVADTEILKKFVQRCRISNLSNMEKKEYEKSLLEYEGVKNAIECERKYSLEEGIKEGLKKGRAEGRAEERVTRNREIVTNMLAMGLDIELISKATNLSTDEIEAIRQQ